MPPSRIVLAYSGGPDTAIAIPWLAETSGAEVVAVTLDLGQGQELEEVRDRALASGAVRAHVLDVREEFVRDYVLPTLRADALGEGRCPMAAALSRPLIAKTLADIADIEQATVVAHGGRSARIEAAIHGLGRTLTVLAPAREWAALDQLEYARACGVPAPAVTPWPVDANLWGRTVDCPVGDAAWSVPESGYRLTRPPAECPVEPAFVEIGLERGVPTAVNGVSMSLVDLIGSLTLIAGAHGVGRVDMIDERPSGDRMRQACEAPAAVLLHTAHRELRRSLATENPGNPENLENLGNPGNIGNFDQISRQYADLVRSGLWFTPVRAALDASVRSAQEQVTGIIRLKLFKGQYQVHDNSLVRTF